MISKKWMTALLCLFMLHALYGVDSVRFNYLTLKPYWPWNGKARISINLQVFSPQEERIWVVFNAIDTTRA